MSPSSQLFDHRLGGNSRSLSSLPDTLQTCNCTPEKLPASPITPPAIEAEQEPHVNNILSTAVHVLSTEATALSYLSRMYSTDLQARNGFVKAVDTITASQARGGKTIVIGVGKSGKIGDKLVASMNSLGLLSQFLNPVEALHGDLGIVRPNDVLFLVTFSGKTPELLQLLPHLPLNIPLIALTSHTSYHTSPLTRGRDNFVLLPAPIPESEVSSFGISAPTTSTTVAMALGDALALSIANHIHTEEGFGPPEVFKKNHPGGAIGLGISPPGMKEDRIRAMAVRWDDIPIAEYASASKENGLLTPAMSETSSESDLDISECSGTSDGKGGMKVIDCLRIAVKSPKGWVRTHGGVISPRRLSSCGNLLAELNSPDLSLVVGRHQMEAVPAETPIREIACSLVARRKVGELLDGAVLGIFEGDKMIGVVEAEEVMEMA